MSPLLHVDRVAKSEVYQCPRWAQEISEFSHDLLQNVYVSRLNGTLSRIESGNGSLNRLREYVSEDLPQWPALRCRLQALLDRYESEMSPLLLVDEARPQMKGDPEHAAADRIVSQIQARWPIQAAEHVHAVHCAVDLVDETYSHVAHLSERAGELTRAEIEEKTSDLEELHRACVALVQPIKRLRRQVRYP